MGILLWIGEGILLLWASYQDLKTNQVYRFVWWLMLTLGLAIGCLNWISLRENFGSFYRSFAGWILFLILQFSLFSSQYGRADCYCFSTCGFLLFLKGGGIFEDVIMMALALLLLFLVQLMRKNIAPGGTLREPVPFVPYIATGFFIMLVWIW